MGHYFNLFHTHETQRYGKENITRNENDNCYNADVAGDLLPDTPADPNLYVEGIYTVDTNCLYDPNIVKPDNCNNLDYSPDTHNMMSYSRQNCRNHFTEQQILRMNYTLTQLRSELLQLIITIDQKRADNTRLSGTSVGRWNGTSFTNLTITNNPITISTNTGSTEVLKGYQEIVNSPSEKYRVWEINQVEYIDSIENHRKFLVTPESNNLTSRFNYTYTGITIKNSLESSSATGGNTQFKDPWLIDYPDPLYGNTLRNQGMSAPFKQRTSPFYPNFTTGYNGDVYKGVFLNQIPDPNDPNKPYYSVKVDAVQDIYLTQTGKTHKFYFQNWGGTNVNYQYANALETPVVFTLDGATAQANLKGTQLSNNPNAFANNSQRKVVKTPDGVMHLTYESMGRIWYETSTDNLHSC